MKKIYLLLLPIILVIVNACTVQTSQPTFTTTAAENKLSTHTALATMSAEGKPTNEILTSTKTPTLISTITRPTTTRTPAGTPIPPSEALLEFKCLSEMVEPGKGVYTGTIVLGGYSQEPSFFFNLNDWEYQPLNEDHVNSDTLDEKISPDHNWLAFHEINRNKLVIHTVDGEQKIELDWKPEWFQLVEWIDGKHLLISITGGEYLIINPFTGSNYNLIDMNELPDFQGPIGVGADWWEPVFNTNLSRAVYTAIADKIVLWDMQKNKPVTSLVSDNDQPFGGNKPVWSPKGDKFVFSYQPAGDVDGWFHDDLYIITKNGEVNRVTNLSSYYKEKSFQNGFSWSPDGNKIAFWSTGQIDKEEVTFPKLAILDLSSKVVTEYCISGGNLLYDSQSPIWSPDGKKIVVEALINNKSKGNYENVGIYMIDFEKDVFYSLLKGDYRLSGWMK